MSKVSFLPNLFVLGAAKAGTTSIYNLLRSHPDICMSDPKEPFFFECEFEKGLKFYEDKYFSNWNGEKIIGEARHRNLYLPYVPERIHSVNPNPKLIVMLRDPVDRAYSHWWHLFSRGLEDLDFEKAIQLDLERIQKGDTIEGDERVAEYCSIEDNVKMFRTYVDSGYYTLQLRKYNSLFKKENLLILLFDDLINKPQNLLDRMTDFLDIDGLKYEELSLEERNVKKVKEASGSQKLIGKYSGLKYLLPVKTKEKILSMFQGTDKKKHRKTLKMLEDHFAPHNASLGEFNIDVSNWNS